MEISWDAAEIFIYLSGSEVGARSSKVSPLSARASAMVRKNDKSRETLISIMKLEFRIGN